MNYIGPIKPACKATISEKILLAIDYRFLPAPYQYHYLRRHNPTIWIFPLVFRASRSLEGRSITLASRLRKTRGEVKNTP
jgi:hypothetical protein